MNQQPPPPPPSPSPPPPSSSISPVLPVAGSNSGSEEMDVISADRYPSSTGSRSTSIASPAPQHGASSVFFPGLIYSPRRPTSASNSTHHQPGGEGGGGRRETGKAAFSCKLSLACPFSLQVVVRDIHHDSHFRSLSLAFQPLTSLAATTRQQQATLPHPRRCRLHWDSDPLLLSSTPSDLNNPQLSLVPVHSVDIHLLCLLLPQDLRQRWGWRRLALSPEKSINSNQPHPHLMLTPHYYPSSVILNQLPTRPTLPSHSTHQNKTVTSSCRSVAVTNHWRTMWIINIRNNM